MSVEFFFFVLQSGLHFIILSYCFLMPDWNKDLLHKAPDYQQELGIGMSLLSMSYFFIIEVGGDSSSASSGLLVILGYKMLHLVLGLLAYFLTDIRILLLINDKQTKLELIEKSNPINNYSAELQKSLNLFNASIAAHNEWTIQTKNAMKSFDGICTSMLNLMKSHTNTVISNFNQLNTSLKSQSDQQKNLNEEFKSQVDSVAKQSKTMNEFLVVSIAEQNNFNKNLKRVTNEIGADFDGLQEKASLLNKGIDEFNSKLDKTLETKLEEFDTGISESLTQAANHLSSNLAAAAEHVAGTYIRDMDSVSKIFNEKMEKAKEKV